LLISILFLSSFFSYSEEKYSADHHYKIAMDAYGRDMCSTAIEHFIQYLHLAKVSEKKKTSINSAITWCKIHKGAQIISRSSGVIGSSNDVMISSNYGGLFSKNSKHFENKPKLVPLPKKD